MINIDLSSDYTYDINSGIPTKISMQYNESIGDAIQYDLISEIELIP